MIRSFICFLIFLFLSSCEEPEVPFSCRIAFESELPTPLTGQILLEGPQGQVLSGALVLVQDPRGAIQKADFDYKTGSHVVQIPSPVSGQYTIKIQSVVLAKEKTFVIPHTVLSSRPNITVLTDESGNSALSAQVMKRSETITIGWSSILGATAYSVHVASGATANFSLNTQGTSCEIPANTLPSSGSYSIQVVAQSLEGDPLFRGANYYSVSQSIGTSFFFTVN